MDNYQQEATRIIELLKQDFLLPDGSLCLKKVGEENLYHNFADLGDVIPFLLYFNEVKFVDNQIKIFENYLKDGVLISEFPTWKIKGLVKSYEYSDLILGLTDYYNFKKDDNSKRILLSNTDKAINIFKLDKKINSFYWPKFGFSLPVIDSRDGMMVELFVDLYNIFGEEKYLLIAKNIYKRLISLDFYNKYNLLPTFSFNIFFNHILKLNQAVICKNNTNALFAFLSLWKVTGDRKIFENMELMIAAIKNKATSGKGGIIRIYQPGQNISQSFLTASFSILDFLCDFYHQFGQEKDLQFARDIADYWLDLQAESGLFPLYNDRSFDFIDSQTDMSIALWKLFELTGDSRYQASADKCLDGIYQFHGKKDYVSSVDIFSGELVNKIKKTKFLALFLKLLILKMELSKGNKIYQDKKLFNLLKDR